MRARRAAALLAGCALLLAPCAGARNALGYPMLMAGDMPDTVDYAAFAPGANSRLPANRFSGVLRLRPRGDAGHRISVADRAYVSAADVASATTWPDDFAYEFVQQGEAIVPVRRGLIASGHPWWDLILEPGRAWDEPDDRGYTRAAIPFSLQEKNANCTHNGVLTFLFRSDGSISRAAAQIASETCQYLQFDLWGLFDATYVPRPVPDRAATIAAYRSEVAARVPRRSLAQLQARFPQLELAHLAIGSPGARTLYGAVVDGINYQSACGTRSGDYPFCDVIDVPSYSLAKSIFAATALMRLQQQHPGAAEQRISGHVPQCPPETWADVTFEQALDMATGNYDSAVFEADEVAPKTAGLFGAPDHAAKIAYSCGAYARRAPPGSTWVYHTSDTYVLGTALAHYLRQFPGHQDDDLYDDLIRAQIFRPLQLSATTATTRRSGDGAAQPFTGWGLTLQPADIARLGLFYARDRGRVGGKELLDHDLLRRALQRDAGHRGLQVYGNPDLRYQLGFWARKLPAAPGCAHDDWVPFMSGFGGISVVLLPGGVIYYNVADDGLSASYDWLVPAQELAKLGKSCPQSGCTRRCL